MLYLNAKLLHDTVHDNIWTNFHSYHNCNGRLTTTLGTSFSDIHSLLQRVLLSFMMILLLKIFNRRSGDLNSFRRLNVFITLLRETLVDKWGFKGNDSIRFP